MKLSDFYFRILLIVAITLTVVSVWLPAPHFIRFKGSLVHRGTNDTELQTLNTKEDRKAKD